MPVALWNEVQKNQNCLLSLPYLTAIEDSFSDTLSFSYLLVLDEATAKPVLIASFQLVPFVYKGDNQPSKILRHCSKNKEGLFMLQMLVCGNVFMAGEHGFLASSAIDTLSLIHI